MTLIFRSGDSKRYKHYRGSRNKKAKPFEICRDYETMKCYELAREKALEAYNEEKVDNKWRNIIIDTAGEEGKTKISIWKATFERACDVMNKKVCELVKQLKESDRQAQVMNAGFYDKLDTMNKKFNKDLETMKNESEKRNVSFMKKAQTQKFVNDLTTLTRENEKRNAGFHCKTYKKNHDDKFKKMCEESQNRNNLYMSRRKHTELDRMNMMNERRTALYMSQRPDSKFDAVMTMNERRTAGFTSKKPVTKYEQMAMWNGQRNALFNLHA